MYGAPGYGAPGYGAPAPGGYAPAPGMGGYAAAPGMGGYAAAPAPSMGGYGGAPAAGMGGGYAAAPGMGGAGGGGFNPYTASGYAPANPAAWALFQSVDTDRTGSINPKELQAALSHGGWVAFSPKTTRMLMRMYDTDRSGTLGYLEFERLLATMDQWRKLFEAADTDRSGKLAVAEVKGSIRALHFTCPDPVLDSMVNAYDDDLSGQLGFDEYIRLLAELSSLTAAFRARDPAGAGHATFSYNDFLALVFSARS